MAMELPECPVCLQNYDGNDAIPRVLGCGHSACEACLAKLPERFPLTIRCPACTRLVKFPPQGPSSLPKNIDLLSLSVSQNPNPSGDSRGSRENSVVDRSCDFLPRFWSDEFYAAWKGWVLPSDAVSVEERGGCCAVSRGKAGSGSAAESLLSRVCFAAGQEVSLVQVACLPALSDSNFEFSYVVRVMKCLSGMREKERGELDLILRASLRKYGKIGGVYGLWGHLDDGFLYLVCERTDESVLRKLGDLRNEFCAFVMVGVEMVEAVIGLHLEGFIAGFFGLSCFGFDEFGRSYVEMGEVLVTGRKIRKSIDDAVSGRMRSDVRDLEASISNLLKDDVFISPELLQDLLCKEGIALEHKKSGYSNGYGSDSWSLACLLLRLLIGKEFTKEFPKMIEENGSEYSKQYSVWIKRVNSLLDTQLGSEYASVKDILLKCLIFDPASRPHLSEVRRSMRELIIMPQFDLASLERVVDGKSSGCCIILGELCQLFKEMSKEQKEDVLGGKEVRDEADLGQIKVERVDKNFVDGLSEGIVKVKDLQGHRDCITGITVGGGFLFSSSFDKTIRVWSLQDFSHVHTFEGHEHKVMAIFYVDQEQHLCITGDSGGGIFVWGINIPFGKEPLKKWYEQKDWRYSGIHALCYSKNGYIYTGCGDKSIKAWLLQDGLLACTMNGHKSVVSTLAICDEVLYSGSWDGTIRLWSLSDHTPLTVLGEDTSGPVTSVLSLAVDRHMLIAAFENGSIKVWRNEVFMKLMQLHEGAIFATSMEGKLLFTGGWDKTVNVQELSGDGLLVDPRPLGSIPCNSAITVLLFWQGKLFVGCADRLVKVYYCGK